jgi:hypothetical protein
MLKGIETSGCLLVSAGHAEVVNRLHRPTKSGRKLLNKKSWVGHLENMQVCMAGTLLIRSEMKHLSFSGIGVRR